MGEEMLTVLRLRRYISEIEYVPLPPTQADRQGSAPSVHAVQNLVDRGVRSAFMVLSELKSDTEDADNEGDEESIWKMSKYYNEINDILLNHSDETYFTFLSLPEFDSAPNEQLYIENLHILTENFPPTALIKCGQKTPVISLDI